MTPTIASIAITVALLTGNGIAVAGSAEATDSPAARIVPTVDVAASPNLGGADGVRRGGQATRIEFDSPDLNADISPYYRLAFVERGSRLQVYEHSAAGVYGPDSVVEKSEETAWTLAHEAINRNPDASVVPALPNWAHRFVTGHARQPEPNRLVIADRPDLVEQHQPHRLHHVRRLFGVE